MIGFVRARILVVDERKKTESTLANILSREDTFDVHLVNDWHQGMSLSREIRFDVILCDGLMPWPDVLEFCRNIRSNPELTSIVFIIVGPPQGIDEKEKGLDAGIDDWIEKSVPASLLIGKINAWLRTRRLFHACKSECEILQEQNKNLLRPIDNPVLIGSYDKLQHETGWKPYWSIEKSLEKIYNYWYNKLS
jgi:sigma-B regulation protein RsbU (phosphoserine phosphatase)